MEGESDETEVMSVPSFLLKRVYEPVGPGDGLRVLVDRLWPRGLRREAAQIDVWLKEIAPSPQLCQWFAHQPERYTEFRTRYLAELAEPQYEQHLRQLREWAETRPVTLLYAARDPVHNHARILWDVLTN